MINRPNTSSPRKMREATGQKNRGAVKKVCICLTSGRRVDLDVAGRGDEGRGAMLGRLAKLSVEAGCEMVDRERKEVLHQAEERSLLPTKTAKFCIGRSSDISSAIQSTCHIQAARLPHRTADELRTLPTKLFAHSCLVQTSHITEKL